VASQVQVRYAELPTSSPSNPTRSQFCLTDNLVMKRLCVLVLGNNLSFFIQSRMSYMSKVGRIDVIMAALEMMLKLLVTPSFGRLFPENKVVV
jgi:hypothetical protein